MAAASDADTTVLVQRALEAQRLRTARMLSQLRLGGVFVTFALTFYLTASAGQSDWGVLVPILGAYASAAIVLYSLARLSNRFAQWAGLGVALVDVPMVF